MWTLVANLPAGSMFMRALAVEHGRNPDWTDTHSLLARVANEAAHGNFMFAQVHFKGPHRRPELITPPGQDPDPADSDVIDVSPPRRQSSVDEIRQFFGMDEVRSTPKGQG